MSDYWSTSTAPPTSLTLEMLQKAFDDCRDYDTSHVKAETEAYQKFLDDVPPEFRDHPGIQRIAQWVAWSQSNPLHPSAAERLAKQYREIVDV